MHLVRSAVELLNERLARGLYRRSGIAPCPEGLIFNCCDYNANLLHLRFDLFSRVFIARQFLAFFLDERGGGFVGEVARKQFLQPLDVRLGFFQFFFFFLFVFGKVNHARQREMNFDGANDERNRIIGLLIERLEIRD